MNDPWKYLAFPVASVAGYLFSLGITAQIQPVLGVSEFLTRLAVIAGTGLIAGFLVDEVIPTYLQHVRSGGRGDMDLGGGDDDFDFE